MRTPDEIIARIHELESGGHDFFGFEREDLIRSLPFPEARRYLKPGATEGEWQPLDTDEQVRERMLEYLPFAWGKATGHRGVSAARSVSRLSAWLWLLGDDEMVAFAEDEANYPQYGAPILAAVSRKYGAAVPDGASEMVADRPCRPDCDEGCGK